MIEFPTIPSDAHYKKDLNDCTAGDLEYLINIRNRRSCRVVVRQ